MCARAADRMKTCLADALWGCLETRSLTGLSVGDVIEVAGVSRGSFYYHFSDLDHLVSWALARELLDSDREGHSFLELAAREEQAEHDAGHEQADVDGTVSYGGETYSLQQADDGSWSLVNSAGEALVALEGTPVALVRTGDTLLVPENRDGGWDVPCYVVGGHTQGITYVVGSDGNPVQGSGDIASVELDGTTLRVTGADGSTTDVALA